MAIKKVDAVPIQGFQNVTVTRMSDHLVEVQHMAKQNKTNNIKKLSCDEYVDLSTGEIKEFKKTKTRAEGLNSLRQTFKKLRYLINNNFTGAPNELFICPTYRGELQTRDHLKVGKDYDNFMKRLKRKFKGVSAVEAIKVLEPHASGNWHMHILLKFPDVERVFIPFAELNELWGNGSVSVRALKDVDNIGAYVSAYLADIEVPDDYEHQDIVVKDVDGQKKKFIKGGRLSFYPTGVNLYSKTKGMKYPERVEMTYEDAKKVVGNLAPHYSQSVEISDSDSDFSNTITYEQYNLKRQ